MVGVVHWEERAEIIEQHEHNRLIRPRSRYVGPDVRHVFPLSRRD